MNFDAIHRPLPPVSIEAGAAQAMQECREAQQETLQRFRDGDRQTTTFLADPRGRLHRGMTKRELEEYEREVKRERLRDLLAALRTERDGCAMRQALADEHNRRNPHDPPQQPASAEEITQEIQRLERELAAI